MPDITEQELDIIEKDLYASCRPVVERLLVAYREVREQLAAIRNYRPVSARACRMCKYEDGVYLSPCVYHQEVEAVEAELAEARAELERRKR